MSSGRKRWARIWWFGAGRGKKTKSNARLKSMEKKSSQTAASQSNPKHERRRIRKEAVSALESVVATGQHQMRSERRVCFVLGSPRLTCGRRTKSSFEESCRSIRRKRRVSSGIERERTRLLDGHRGRHAWRLWVSGSSNGR